MSDNEVHGKYSLFWNSGKKGPCMNGNLKFAEKYHYVRMPPIRKLARHCILTSTQKQEFKY